MCEKLHKILITEEFINDLEEIKAVVEKVNLTKVQWYESATETAHQQILPMVAKKIVKRRKRKTI